MKQSIIAIAVLGCLAGGPAAASPDLAGVRLSLTLEEVPVVTLLNMIADQNNLNLVVSGQVAGEVTLRLDQVDIRSALDAILSPMGYNFYINKEVIVVKPFDAYAPGELETHIVTLRYADPVTVKNALEPLLTTKGNIVVLDKAVTTSALSSPYKANRLLITDLPVAMPEMLRMIEQIDKQDRLISIEVKLIETVVDDNSKVGFSWPSAITTTLGVGEGSDSGSTGSTSTLSQTPAGTYNPMTGDWKWARLSVGQLKLVLDLMEQEGNSKLLSDPRITTLENHEAEIKIQTIVPIPTINRFTEGAATTDILTFQDEEVGISLQVTPRINEDSLITLEVMPKVEDIVGFAGPPDNQKPITTSRSVRTTITVADGETAALGGLLKEDEIENISRVPVLGHIPFLGKLLFTNKSVDKSTTDLIILITPRVLK